MNGFRLTLLAPTLVLVGCLLLLNSCAEVESLSVNGKSPVSRRGWLEQATAATGAALIALPPSSSSAAELVPTTASAATSQAAGRAYFPTLTPPFINRATYRYNLGRNAWAFEQLLAFVNVTATIRCNVIQLEGGGLWVHSPQWPTGEFMELLADLNQPVKHIVLPCNALEHKAPMKDFCKRFPAASVWVSPGQYGPFGSCGLSTKEKMAMPYRIDGILGDTRSDPPPWADEFEIATLYESLPENAGPVSEIAFLHKPTKTLVATDAVVYIPNGKAPAIFSTYFDDATIADPTFWQKSVLQAVFLPLRTDNDGNYPGFEALQERLVRAPILRAFADARAPTEVKEWIATISKWDFDRILTSHFSSPIRATPQEFEDAFAYLSTRSSSDLAKKLPPIACQDWELLEGLNQAIAENKLGAPATFDYKVGCLY